MSLINREKAIKKFQNYQRDCEEANDDSASVFADVVTELKDMPDESRQAERGDGCEYCNGDALKNLVLFHQFGEPKVAMHGGSQPIPEEQKPLFCPHCGRKL